MFHGFPDAGTALRSPKFVYGPLCFAPSFQTKRAEVLGEQLHKQKTMYNGQALDGGKGSDCNAARMAFFAI